VTRSLAASGVESESLEEEAIEIGYS